MNEIRLIGDELFILSRDWLDNFYIITEENQDYMQFPLQGGDAFSLVIRNSEFIGYL